MAQNIILISKILIISVLFGTAVVHSIFTKQQTLIKNILPSKYVDIWEGKSITGKEIDGRSNKIEPGPDFRLPTSLTPFSYDVKLRPIFDADYPSIGRKNTAPGHVNILVLCNEATDKVVLHSNLIENDDDSILVTDSASKTPVGVLGVEYDVVRNFLTINLSENLTSGIQYEISMDFIAPVPPNDGVRGLYSEEYFDPITNQTKFMAVTQLEPLRARQVFPCLDEPNFKPVFNVVLGRTENYTALANAPLRSTTPDEENPGWFWDTFETSVPMPTYLFAIGISNYTFTLAPPELYRMPVKVHGPQDLISRGDMDLAANASAILMKHFEEKYGIEYQVPKLDTISVPFKRGAMENNGLITYGEYLLKYNEDSTTVDLRKMFNIIGHELGHQWFGNLVTCKWWSDIWLNEGFATYVSFASMQELWPDFDMKTEMLGSVNNALIFDATPSTHPIHQEAYDAEQISTNMDTIGYDKGASIVRLMVSFLGEEVFYNGIRQYLQNHKNSVAEQDDLFTALNEAAINANLELPKSVNEIMHGWTLQSGFPLVRVALDKETNTVTISQEPWTKTNITTTWDIPISYVIIDQNEVKRTGLLWLLNNGQPKQLNLESSTESVVLNTDAGGYYRTLYEESIYSQMNMETISNVLSPDGKVRLLDDQYTLANEGLIPIQHALNFTRLSSEDDPTVWSIALKYLQKVKNFYRRLYFESPGENRDFPALESFLNLGLTRQLTRIPEDVHGKPTSLAILRGQVFEWFCDIRSNHNSFCQEYTEFLLTQWEGNPLKNPVPTDLRPAAYCTIVEYHRDRGFNWLLDQYFVPTTTSVEKQRLIAALGCSKNLTQIDLLYELTIFANATDGRRIDRAHTTPMFQNLVIRSLEGNNQIEEVFRRQSEAIPDYYERDVDKVVEIFTPLNEHGCTPKADLFLENIWRFNTPFFGDAFQQIQAQMGLNRQWLGEYQGNITEFFEANPSLS